MRLFLVVFDKCYYPVYYLNVEYKLTVHAKKRADERGITDWLISEALRQPTKILRDAEGKLLVKKIYHRQGQVRLLLIVGTVEYAVLKIITIIDTSKVKKYL